MILSIDTAYWVPQSLAETWRREASHKAVPSCAQ